MIRLAILLLVALAPGIGAAQSIAKNELAAIRAEFLAAYRSAQNGVTAAEDSAALRAYPLYEYLDAVRIEYELASISGRYGAADRSADNFLRLHRSSPVARPIQQAWLSSLARRGLHRELIDQFDSEAAGSRLQCQYLTARIAVDELVNIEPLVLRRWLSADQQPNECEIVFEWGRTQDIINSELVEQRVRLLLGNGQSSFARVIARRLPPARAEPLLNWAALLEDPRRSFAMLIESPAASAPDIEAVQHAWSRFSRNDPIGALNLIGGLLEALEADRDTASILHRSLALGLAWDRQPQALTHFTEVQPRDLDDATREWQTRAALWAGDWPSVEHSIASMSPARRNESAWRYWSARAAAELGDQARARTDYEAILTDDNFYSALAASHLDQPFRPTRERIEFPAESVEEIVRIPEFLRARELYFAGFEMFARREWNTGYAELPERLKRPSITTAASWGWYEIAVFTATKNRVFNDYDLLYPQAHAEHIPAAAAMANIGGDLINALIRQESLFSPTAVSTADALGLMQLQLPTARRAADRWGMDRPSRNALFDPKTNIMLGAAQLKSLIEEFDGQILPSLAGYNAGYYAAERWLPESIADADIWVENIPFNETRAYVRRVLWHSLVYRWLATQRIQSASEWLTPIRNPNWQNTD
jgi:soluble lytic murein transglycosylase